MFNRLEPLEPRRLFDVVPDALEPNNSFAAATDIGSGDKNLNLSIHAADSDYFKWIAPATGQTTIDCLFTQNPAQGQGDLELWLTAEDRTIIGTSLSEDDNEQIVKSLVAGTTYYIRVFGYLNAPNPNYQLIITTPNVAPAVVGQSFDFQTGQRIVHQFNENVLPSLTASDLAVTHVGTGQTYPVAIDYNTLTNKATYTFATRLPDGNYTAVLAAGSVEDSTGLELANDVTLNFHVLSADANRDRKVDHLDFEILYLKMNQAGTFGDGDFNYDGQVRFDDFQILERQFGAGVAAPASSVLAPAKPAVRTTRVTSVVQTPVVHFGARRIRARFVSV